MLRNDVTTKITKTGSLGDLQFSLRRRSLVEALILPICIQVVVRYLLSSPLK